MKFLRSWFASVLAVTTSSLLLVSCSHENFVPVAPAEVSLKQQIPAASSIEAAIIANRFNDNLGKFAPAKSLSTSRIAASLLTTSIYTVTDLGTFGGEFSAALDINTAGHQIVGAATLASGALRPFLYENGQLINLGTLGGADGIASSINDAGDIVGQADNAQGLRRGFLYHNGVMTEIPTLGGSESRASDINASGQIVGQARLPGNNNHAYLYENGQMFDLGTLGGTTSWANSISGSGQIVGGSHTLPDQDWHAYFRVNGVMTDLGTFAGGRQSVVFSQNDNGQMVGWSDMAGSNIYRAALWSQRYDHRSWHTRR